jgi:FkbM family methyltransferase
VPATLASTEIAIAGARRPFYFRAESGGDQGVLEQVFRQADYSLASLQQLGVFTSYYRALLARGAQPLIVDCGANIGASAVWFSLSYPQCHLVAVEPERNNRELLAKNCEGLDCTLVAGGISCSDGTMFLDDPGQGDWGFRLSADRGSYEVPTHSARALVQRFTDRGQVPLIFKSDIEGGEAALFSKDTEWVDSFPLVIVELHDWMLPGQANSRNFLRTIAALDMDFVYRGENVFCFNNRLLRPWMSEPSHRIEELRQLAIARPSVEAFLDLSLAYYEGNEFAACVTASSEALRLEPNSSLALNNLGLALAQLERWDEAESAFDRALTLAPDFQLARNNLAWIRSRVASAPSKG